MKIKSENMYTLLSIDAWRNADGWDWNNWFLIEENVYIEYPVSARKLLNFMRRNGWLADCSKGKLAIEDDGYNIVIVNKNTREPFYAFEPQWEM